MRSQDEAIRRVICAVAMLAGVVLVGSMHFGCTRPQANPGCSGFPQASRWSKPTSECPLPDERISQIASADRKTSLYWKSPRPTSTQRHQPNLQDAPPEGTGGLPKGRETTALKQADDLSKHGTEQSFEPMRTPKPNAREKVLNESKNGPVSLLADHPGPGSTKKRPSAPALGGPSERPPS